MTPGWFLIPAVVNGGLTLGVLLLGRRGQRHAVAAAVLVFVAYLCAIWFWPDPTLPRLLYLWPYAAILAVTWLPGAMMAIMAWRQVGRPASALAVASVCTGVGLGAAFIFTSFWFACSILGKGDCL